MIYAIFNYLFTVCKHAPHDLYNCAFSILAYFLTSIDRYAALFAPYIRPLYAPYSKFFFNNFSLKAYIVYLISIVAIIGFFFFWQPYFFYIFIYFELFAFLFSATFPFYSYLIRRAILIFFFSLAMIDTFGDFDEPLILLHDFLSYFGLADSFSVIGTHLCIQEVIAGYDFWMYYFAVFFAPYLALTLVLLAPFASFVICFSFGYLIGYRACGYVASFFIFVAFFSASYLLFLYPVYRQEFFESVYQASWSPESFFYLKNIRLIMDFEVYSFVERSTSMGVYLDFGVFIDAPFLFSCFEFGVDSVAAIFIFVVTFISFLVHLYSIEYMKNDPHTVRFFGLLSFFTFSMLVLVTSVDLVIMFIGWEGVGLSSFLLISFWYTRVPALKSALKAILMNKIGDMFLLFAIVIIGYYSGGDMSFFLASENITHQDFITSTGRLCGMRMIDFIAVLLTLAAFVKSAQLFFHTWLPDAMEGPTPVSALLHAATMVTAGVYLVVRFSFIIEFSYVARLLMLVVASWTLIVTSLIALFQYDIKKIIAYSTCGQLAMMFIACSLSGYDYALFHFFNHAFFKCLLFLLAGLIIHDLKNEQDIRVMGNLSAVMPYTFYAFTLAMVSSIGFPFLSGAVSKDLILALIDDRIIESAWGFWTTKFSYFFYVLYFLKVRFAVVVLTSFYMLRLYYYVFLCFPNYRRNIFNKPSYLDPIARSPIYGFVISVLVLLSLSSGKIFKNLFIFTDCNYIDIHNDILTLNTDTMRIASSFHFHFITHFTLLAILAGAAYYFSWLKKNGHVSFLLTSFNFLKLFNDTLKHDTSYVMGVLEEWEPKEREKFLRHFLRPLDWSIKIFWFFNKKCYFDDIYNYFIVYSFVVFSNYIRVGVERGVFLFLADQLVSLSKKILSMCGYLMVHSILANAAFYILFFALLWYWF